MIDQTGRTTLGKETYTGPIKEAERRLNQILKQISNTEIRKRKIKKESSEKAKPKAKKVRFNLYAPEAEKVFLKGDFDNWDFDNLLMKFVHLRMLTHRKQLAPKGIPVLIILVDVSIQN